MRTRKEIEEYFRRCSVCGKPGSNPYGECKCSYETNEVPLQIEILLDIRDLLTKEK